MKRILVLNTIVSGSDVRDILKVFPNIENSFKQRKHYDEYYFYNVEVELTIEIIQKLNDLCYGVEIGYEEVKIK